MINVIIIFLCICIIILSIRLSKKLKLDNTKIKEYDALQVRINDMNNECEALEKAIDDYHESIENYQNKILDLQNKYQEALNKKSNDLDKYFEQQKEFRQTQLDEEFEIRARNKESELQLNYYTNKHKYDKLNDELNKKTEKIILEAEKSQNNIIQETQLLQNKFESLLAPLRQYEKDQQEKLFYTIQVPDEYKDDIQFLVNTVSQKVSHPDVINKLVWSEYVKPYLDQTFKRIEIKDEPGVYKLTNINNNKCYIGKSTNVKKRITDHMKSSVGISTIADQMVHHEIWKTGFWNWSIEIITYCDKDKLGELEQYYIDFFKARTYGYNIARGG